MTTSLLSSRISAGRAAGLVAGAIFASAAAIDIARVWTCASKLPPGTVEVTQTMSGALVALFLLTGFILALRVEALAPVCVVAFYALIAHGSALVLSGEVIGALFLGIVPLVIVLARVTMGDTWTARRFLPTYPAPARGVAHAASPSLSTTLA